MNFARGGFKEKIPALHRTVRVPFYDAHFALRHGQLDVEVAAVEGVAGSGERALHRGTIGKGDEAEAPAAQEESNDRLHLGMIHDYDCKPDISIFDFFNPLYPARPPYSLKR